MAVSVKASQGRLALLPAGRSASLWPATSCGDAGSRTEPLPSPRFERLASLARLAATAARSCRASPGVGGRAPREPACSLSSWHRGVCSPSEVGTLPDGAVTQNRLLGHSHGLSSHEGSLGNLPTSLLIFQELSSQALIETPKNVKRTQSRPQPPLLPQDVPAA